MILFSQNLSDHLQIRLNSHCLFVFTLNCCPGHLNNYNKIIIELKLDKLTGSDTEYIFMTAGNSYSVAAQMQNVNFYDSRQ